MKTLVEISIDIFVAVAARTDLFTFSQEEETVQQLDTCGIQLVCGSIDTKLIELKHRKSIT